MYVTLDNTLSLIESSITPDKISNYTSPIFEETRVDITKDAASISNKFTTKPQGILLQDTYNNPFFSIRPRPKYDTSNIDLIEVFTRYREIHSSAKSLFLPWHYVVEMVNDRFFVFNTRPIDTKFPLTTNDAKKRKETSDWDEVTKMFIKDNIFDISEAIHVCIIGDTSSDVYTRAIYELIGRVCMLPIIRLTKIPGALYQRVFPLNLGGRFKFDQISKFIRK